MCKVIITEKETGNEVLKKQFTSEGTAISFMEFFKRWINDKYIDIKIESLSEKKKPREIIRKIKEKYGGEDESKD